MNKVLLGLLLGALLGAIDGGTAWFTPSVRAQLAGIIVGSTVKGLIAGMAAGFFARKVNSVPLGILFGLGVGALLLNSGSILDYQLNTPGVIGSGANTLVNVAGNLTLAGVLNVTDGGSFGSGAYRSR